MNALFYIKKFPVDIIETAPRKLDMLNVAQEIKALRSPPGNRLKMLRGNLEYYYSIRVNDQLRIIFKWGARNAIEVVLTDYH